MTKLTPTVLRIRASENKTRFITFGYKLTDTNVSPFECVHIRPFGQTELDIDEVLELFLTETPIDRELKREQGADNFSWDVEIQRETPSKTNSGNGWMVTFYTHKFEGMANKADASRLRNQSTGQVRGLVAEWCSKYQEAETII